MSVEIRKLQKREPLQLRGKTTGFYLFKDLMGRLDMGFFETENGGTIAPQSESKWVAFISTETKGKNSGTKETDKEKGTRRRF